MKKLTILIISVLIMAMMVISPSVFAAGAESATGIKSEVLAASVTPDVGVAYRTHVQNKGWESTWALNGGIAGTEGQGLRLEGIQIKLTGVNQPAGARIEYRTHVQNNGWESDWTSDGNTAGTEGQSLRLEAIEMRLLNMPGYSVQYRVHVQNNGWENAWSADGDSAGTEGRSLRLEAIEIRLVKAISAPEGLTAQAASQAIALTWNGVPEADSYTVYQAATMDGDYAEAVTGLTATTYEVSNLEDGQRYYYKVKATAVGADSPLSDAATAIASVDDQGNVLLGNRLLISNASTDIENTQSTGTLIPGTEVLETAKIDQAPFAIDVVLPFEPAEGQNPIDINDGSVLATSEAEELNMTKDFYTHSFETGIVGQTHARLAYVGTHVQIWVDTNDSKMMLTDADARRMGEEFDNTIYPLVTENFYTESDVNGDDKIAILCFDIQDGLDEESFSHIGGYFYDGDIYDEADSNKREIFYADTYPTMGSDPNNPDLTQIFGLLVHEFQHMVNCNRNQIVEQSQPMNSWLNEALSQAAAVMYEGALESRGEKNDYYTSGIFWYHNQSATIRDGRSLLDFNMDNDDILANYALSYFFAQYLRTQVDAALGSGNDVTVFNELIIDTGTEFEAVEHVMQKYVDPNLTFGDIMTNFRAAMVVRADTGVFGFNGEDAYDELSTPLYTGGTTNLSGGGAIVTAIDAPFTIPEDKGTDIDYLGIFR